MSDKKYSWDVGSAWRKFGSDVTLSINMGPVSVSKQITGSCNREVDAYRCCSRCGRHFNFHSGGFCPK
ncbi:hypothetical protein [Acanthamoeba polyphaga mimivirus]|uniref:Uncharacterized protein n=1 Tax=Acanthamoeba polyphaga mimivirus TaxID=212035 RepID=A0A0G2Y541_MIMIV|nr:hypothetical protein [Acanthamoeba polyphaga mimivirus]